MGVGKSGKKIVSDTDDVIIDAGLKRNLGVRNQLDEMNSGEVGISTIS